MNTEEYLIARIGTMKLGIYCRDLLNVYSERIKLVKIFQQGRMYRGIARINNTVMQVIDLRRRIGMPDAEETPDQKLTLISFQPSMTTTVAIVVDEIIGMRSISTEHLQTPMRNVSNDQGNVHLLFPSVAMMSDGELIHLLDATYITKTEPIIDDAGELELF